MTETYSVAVDFSGVSPETYQLQQEIINSSIITSIERIDRVDDAIHIVFSSTITVDEKTTLDGLISSHVPNTQNNIVSSDGYIQLISNLADNQAIRIIANDNAGGIDINAGLGGITIDTTNVVSIDAGALINISNTAGNIELDSNGLIDLNSASGINIGNDSDAVPINIGTGASSRIITVGNTTGTTGIIINSGTSGVTLSSGSSGGITLGGSGSGAINIGNDTGTGAINIGTGFANKVVSIGSTSGTSTTAIHSGTWGLTIGNDANSGEIQIANVSQAKTIILGNTTSGSRIFRRVGSGGLIQTQPTPTSLSDSNTTLSIASLLSPGIFTGSPSLDRTLTLPTASDAVAGISGVQVDDCIDFTIINTAGSLLKWTIAMGTGGTLVGLSDIWAVTSLTGTVIGTGVATFRMRFTNVTSSSEAYTVYRIG